MKSLDDFIVTVKGLLSHELCQQLIKHYSHDLEPALVEGNVTHPDRTCTQKLFEDFELDWPMARAVTKYRKRHPGHPTAQVTDYTGYLFLRYGEGQFYKQHVDSFPGVPRLLTISIALNDDFEGGEWAWCDRTVVKRFKTGDAVIFPSNIMFPHEILPVTKGERHAVITWFTP